MNKEYIDKLSFDIIGAEIEVHKFLGKGLLESVYHECMKEELKFRKLNFETEKNIPIIYRDKKLTSNFRCDLLVENCIVVELKSVVGVHPVFESQVLTYMNLLKVPKGILINFNSNNIFKDGQKTFVNDILRKFKIVLSHIKINIYLCLNLESKFYVFLFIIQLKKKLCTYVFKIENRKCTFVKINAS